MAVIPDVVYNHATETVPSQNVVDSQQRPAANNPYFNVSAPHPTFSMILTTTTGAEICETQFLLRSTRSTAFGSTHQGIHQNKNGSPNIGQR